MIMISQVYDISDSLNIFERARWVACLLGSTRGHGCRDVIPSGRGINKNTFDVGDGDVPAAWPPDSSGRNKGVCSFLCALCSPCSGRRRNLILSYAPNHLAFSPQRFLIATTLPESSSTINTSSLYLSSIRHILLDISKTLTPSNPCYPCTYIRRQMTTKPPPRSIGQEATPAQHLARSHSRATSGK